MTIPVHYTYQNYPFSPRATRYSQSVGMLTAWFPCCVWGFFWLGIINYILDYCGVPENTAVIMATITLPLYIFLIRKLKKKLTEKFRR